MDKREYFSRNDSPINCSMDEKAVTMTNAVRISSAADVLSARTRTNRPPMIYKPVRRQIEYLPDGGVEFNMSAPTAQTVELGACRGNMWWRQHPERYPMEKQPDGSWRAVVYDIPVGFHTMVYYVDGVETLNKKAPVYYSSGAVNAVDVPEPGVDFYLMKDVPHGTVRREIFYSTVTNRPRICWVYTPPGYDDDQDKRYPVWYLQHGGGENETSWIWHGKIDCIMDNMIAAGLCREMIVVCNPGYVYNDDDSDELFLPGDFDAFLEKDCIPFIDSRFRTIPEKSSRALAGLSMGSFQTQKAACLRPYLFDYIGIFSGPVVMCEGFDAAPYYEDPKSFSEQFKLLFYSMGYDEGAQIMVDELQPYIDKGLRCEIHTCPGHHEWQVWRKAAFEFAKRIFLN